MSIDVVDFVIWRARSATLFPYTTLFRSEDREHPRDRLDDVGCVAVRLLARRQPGVESLEQVRMGVRHGRSLPDRLEEHTSELQSQSNIVCRLLLEKKKAEQTIRF